MPDDTTPGGFADDTGGDAPEATAEREGAAREATTERKVNADRGPAAASRPAADQTSAWRRPDADAVRYFHEFTRPWPPGAVAPPTREVDGERTTGVSFLPRPPADAPAAGIGRSASAAIRVALAHSPLVVLLATAGLVAYGAVSPRVGGVGTFLPAAVGEVSGLLGVAAAGWLALAFLLGWLFASGDDHPDAASAATQTVQLLWPFVVYGGLLVLAAGTALSTFLVATIPPSSLEPNVVYASGFLLLLYVGGPLVYDGLVRTELLFETLHETGIVRDDERADYAALRDELASTLNSHVAGIPTALLIAVVFVAQFVVLWREGAGPFNLDALPTLALAVAVDVVVVLVAVQFLVLVRFLNELLDDEVGDRIRLVYRPAHEDGAGGFLDLGRFATRVNTLLLLAGGYLVYRLHVQGLRDPLSPFAAGTTAGEAVVWTLSYALPVAVYAAVIAVWLYFSFWQIHRKMVREKAAYIREQADDPERADPADLERWEAYDNAPEWPIRYRLLLTIVSLDVLSVALGLTSVL